MKLKPSLQYALILLIFTFYSCKTLKPLAPANEESAIPNIVQPVSNVEVPVSVDLKNYIVQAENSVPLKFADNQQACQGLSYAYTFTRTPFTITGTNNVASLKFTGSYGISASYCAKCAAVFGSGPRCIVPTVSAQCGWGDEPQRRMVISYQSTISVMPDYHLRSKTVLFPAPKPIDRCNILLGNIDVTDRLIQYLAGPLNDLGKQVDTKIAAYNIRPMVEQLWKNLATEYKMEDVGYLSINPQSVRLSSFSLTGSQLNFSVGLSAKPIVTTVSIAAPPKPLPNLSTYVPAKGIIVYLDLVENYDHLTDMVNKQVAGQTTKVAGNEFIVDHARVFGTGKQLVMQIDFSGSSSGTIYLVATPTYDPVTHILSFPDLSFDLQTKAWMLKVAKWMFNGKIVDAIRQKAAYNFTKFLADSKTRIQKQMSRDYGNNISSEVIIQDMDIQAIYPTVDKLVIRTLSNGQLKVKVVM